MNFKRRRAKPSMNPVQIIVNLPKDIQVYLKTFLTHTRYPLIIRVEGPSDYPNDGRDVYQCSILPSPWDATRFCFNRDNKRDFPGYANDWKNKLRIPSNMTVTRASVSRRIANEYTRPRVMDEDDSTTSLTELTIHSRCCAKHRVPIIMRSDQDRAGYPVVAGHDVDGDMLQLDHAEPNYGHYQGPIPLAYGGDKPPDRGFVQLLTLFGDNLDPHTAAQQLIERVITHWTPCSEDMYACIEDVFELGASEADGAEASAGSPSLYVDTNELFQ